MAFKKGHEVPEEWRKKIRERMKGNKICVGRKYSKGTIEKMRKAKLGKMPNMEGLKRKRIEDGIWNKGLRKDTDERIAKYGNKLSEKLKKEYKEGNRIPPWLGKKHSDETKLKLHLANKGNPSPRKGVKCSKETIEKIRLGNRGKKLSEEHKKILRNSVLGKKQSEDHKKKRLESRIKNNTLWHTEKTKEKIKKNRAKQVMPIKDTKIEKKIQRYLKSLNIDFFTHQYIKEIEHSYQCDILIPSMNLVIECDGNYWHKYPIGTEVDHIRTKELIEKGFKVLRLWECEIKIMSQNDLKSKLGGVLNGN